MKTAYCALKWPFSANRISLHFENTGSQAIPILSEAIRHEKQKLPHKYSMAVKIRPGFLFVFAAQAEISWPAFLFAIADFRMHRYYRNSIVFFISQTT